MSLKRITKLFVLISFLVFAISAKANNITYKTIKIPFRYVQSFIILDVQVQKVLPLKLIFDTGAEQTILFEEKWTNIISDSYQREIKVIGSDLQQELSAILTSPLNLMFENKYEFSSPLIVLKDHITNISQVIGESIHGILSASVFSNYIIEIDYKNQWLILHDKNYTIPPSFKKIPIEIYKNKPYLKVNVESKPGSDQLLNLLLDTGASLSILMYSDSSTTLQLPEKIIPGYLGSGLGGMLTGFVGKINKLQFDTFSLPGVITHFLKIETSIALNESHRKNGLIGNQMLDKFTLLFDYQNANLYIKPLKKYQETLEYDKSGMLVISGGTDLQRFYVAYVVPGTPAYEAGIRENDEILKFNGWPVSFYSLSKINTKLQGKANKKITLKVRRDTQKLKFSFVLRDLI